MDWFEFIYDVILAGSLVISALYSYETFKLTLKIAKDTADLKYAEQCNNNGICHIINMIESHNLGQEEVKKEN